MMEVTAPGRTARLRSRSGSQRTSWPLGMNDSVADNLQPVDSAELADVSGDDRELVGEGDCCYPRVVIADPPSNRLERTVNKSKANSGLLVDAQNGQPQGRPSKRRPIWALEANRKFTVSDDRSAQPQPRQACADSPHYFWASLEVDKVACVENHPARLPDPLP